MTTPTDDNYRDAAVVIADCVVSHDAEIIRSEGSAYVKVWLRVVADTALAVKPG